MSDAACEHHRRNHYHITSNKAKLANRLQNAEVRQTDNKPVIEELGEHVFVLYTNSLQGQLTLR